MNIVDHERNTDRLVAHFHSGAMLLDTVSEQTGSRQEAMSVIVADTASSFISEQTVSRRGQAANHLSDWHRSLKIRSSNIFAALTDPASEQPMSRNDANHTPELEALHAVRRGVGRAMRREYRRAQRSSKQNAC